MLFSPEFGKTLIRAVMRGPVPFSPKQEAAIKDQLYNAPTEWIEAGTTIAHYLNSVHAREGLLYGPNSDTPTGGTKPD